MKDFSRSLLLFPPVRLCRETMKEASVPLGIGYVAACAREEIDVRIMDAVVESDHERELPGGFTWYGSPLSEIRETIESYQPSIVGMTCLFSSVFPVIREVCREIKSIDPDIFTIVGGTYPNFMAERCLSDPGLDAVCLGEGEETFVEVVRALREEKSLKGVDGLAFKEKGRVVINPKTRWIENLDEIPFPARDLMRMDLYQKKGVPHSLTSSSKDLAAMITSRGCPAHCVYCSSTRFWGNRYRFRSPENVLNEIGELIGRWGVEEIQFEDDNVTANRERAKAIFRGIVERGYKIKFNFPNGVALWTLDEEMVDLMVEAGCYEMTLAFESGCQEVLSRIVKKPNNLEKAARIAEYVKGRKIRTDAFYILGFPGETREQIQETINFANRVKTDMAYFFVANPLPGTELYAVASERNMLRPDFDFENLTYTRSAYNDEVFKPGELEKIASRAFLSYALRSMIRNPGTFIRRFFIDLLFRRPRYALEVLTRIWRRAFPSSPGQ